MRIYIFSLTLFLSIAAQSQQTITGKITGSNSQPLPGATISLKKANTSVIAGNLGMFSISLKSIPDTLVVTAAGYKAKSLVVSAYNLSPLAIELELTTKELDEVNIISTGYEKLPKERITASFQQLNYDVLNQQVSTGIVERLEAVSNLLFDKNANHPAITLRGLSSINGPKDLLIVLDNFPYEGSITDINPNDIESITILKDAAAASVWGARAGNGVIVITTKKGRFSQPLRITVNANTTIIAKPGLFDLPLIASKDFIDLERFLFSKGNRFSDTALSSKPAFTPVYEILFKQRSGQLTAAQADAMIAALENIDYRGDMEKYLYRPAVNQQHALNLSAGSSKFAWSLSGGYDRNVSNLDLPSSRISLRSEGKFLPFKNVQLSFGLTYTDAVSGSGRPSYNGITYNGSILYPYAKLADDNGNPLPVIKTYRQVYKDTTGMGKLLDWNYYPLDDYNHTISTSQSKHLLANVAVQYRVAKGLNFSLIYQHESQENDGRTLNDINSFFTRDLINRFSVLNRATGVIKYNLPKADILSLSTSSLVSRSGRGQLSYSGTWNKHSMSAIAGAEVREVATKSNSNTVYGYDAAHAVASNVDFVNTYPSYVTGSSLAITNGLSFKELLGRFVSYYANAAYTFDRRYIFSLSGRKDASNLFGVNTNDKWNPLWSAGLGWNVSGESFYKFHALPYLKFRATLGYSGNVDQKRSAVTTIRYSAITSPGTNYPFASLSQFPNPELRWEKVRMINLAFDFASKNDRISGSIEYFNKTATDLLGPAPLDQTTGLGATSLTKNVASMKGNGWDIVVNSKNIDRSFTWNTTLIFNYYRDKITSYYLINTGGGNFVSNGNTINALLGKPVYSVFAYRWAGLDPANGNPLGFINGQPSADYNTLTGSSLKIDDLVYKGRALPPFYGSLSNTVSWKGVSVTASLLYKLGHVFKRESLTSYVNLFSNGSGHSDFALRWQKPGDELYTVVPSMVYPAVAKRDQFYNGSEVLFENAGFIRFQFINLSYSLPHSLLNKWRVRQLDIYTVINNIGLLWTANKKHLDPEYPALPPSRSFSFGIRTTF
jgi:TonB-linked SusC/RagA family outer membrane protein